MKPDSSQPTREKLELADEIEEYLTYLNPQARSAPLLRKAAATLRASVPADAPFTLQTPMTDFSKLRAEEALQRQATMKPDIARLAADLVAAGEIETVPADAGMGKKERRAVQENLREAWSALSLIRETIETLGPVGVVQASEHLDGPTFMHEAEALVKGILALVEAPDQRDTDDAICNSCKAGKDCGDPDCPNSPGSGRPLPPRDAVREELMLLPVRVVEPSDAANGGLIKLPSGRSILLSKQDAAFLQHDIAVKEALEKITKLYVDAPGWANPTPTTELIYKMYTTARDALAALPPAQEKQK
jgi:hypothetical protein